MDEYWQVDMSLRVVDKDEAKVATGGAATILSGSKVASFSGLTGLCGNFFPL